MSSSSSQFYPPRARGWGRLRSVAAFFRRIRYASPLEIPKGLGSTICGLLLPGYAFRLFGYKMVAEIAVSLYGVAAFLFVANLGLPFANYAFSFLIAIHALSALVMTRNFSVEPTLGRRLWSAASVLVLIIICYNLALTAFGYVVTPLNYNRKVYVVNGLASSRKVGRGDQVAYHIRAAGHTFRTAYEHGAVIVEDGFGIGEVLAVAGDQIEFTKKEFTVNGISQPRKLRMPESGKIVVPEKHWFIWPEFAITVQGQAAQIQADQMLARMGMVDADDFVGTIFRHWFWRKQL